MTLPVADVRQDVETHRLRRQRRRRLLRRRPRSPRSRVGADLTALASDTGVGDRCRGPADGSLVSGRMSEAPSDGNDTIDALSVEHRTFPPPEHIKRDALVTGTWMYDEAAKDDEGFWARQAAELLDWSKDWDTICEWDLPYAKWFVGGQLNVSYNCLDRHVARRARRQGRDPLRGRARRHPDDHLRRAARRGAALRQRAEGPRRRQSGDRVNIYLPMIPEAAVAMLACARIGAAHSVVFGGFSSQALSDRINDAEAKVLITADGGYRRGEVFPLKPAADEALASTPTIEHVVVVRRGGNDVPMQEGRDHWYHDLVEAADADVPGRADGRRAAAVPPLHVGHDRQARRASCTRPAAT